MVKMVLIVDALPIPDGYPDPADDEADDWAATPLEFIESLADQERNDLLALTTDLFNAPPEERAHRATLLFEKIEAANGYAPITDEHKQWIVEALEEMAALRSAHVKEHAERAALSWIIQTSTALSRPATPSPSLLNLGVSLPPLQLQRLDGTTTAIPLPDITDEEFLQVMQEFPTGWTEREAERRRADEWIEQHSVDLTPEEWTTAWNAARAATHATQTSSSPVGAIFAALREAWQQFGYLPYNGLDLRRPTEKVPQWVLEAYLLVKLPQRLPRPIIAPAFMHDGREGLGRISSDQITFGLYDALIAPKDAWAKTAKGWPIYRPDPNSDTLAIRVFPVVENPNNLDAQRAEMWHIVQELGVSDFDVIAMMMAQVLVEGRSDGRAILLADTMLDYRGKSRRRDEDGHSAGHQPKLRANIAESVYRVAHLRITADALPLLTYNAKGGLAKSAMNINAPVVELHSNYSRQRDDKTLLWEYSLGRWFMTFREKPHAYTAYMLERALSYHPIKQQWAKQLAYYLALEMRRNADNGQELHRPAAWFIKGARIPCDQRYALKVKDRLEKGLRQLAKDGLIRIVQDDDIIDASSVALDQWSPKGTDDLKGRNWLGGYLKLNVGVRCDADTEGRYDIEIRKRKAIAQEQRAKKSTGGKGQKGTAK